MQEILEKKSTAINEKKSGPRPAANRMDAVVYNQKGEQVGKIKIPERVFGLRWNADLVHQVVTSMRSSGRSGTAHTKSRADVRGGGKKPWRQKGTGRARHGSIRSPIWVGGGVAHGPRKEKNYLRKVNKKMRIKALFSVLSRKFYDKELFFVDEFKIPSPKTKKAVEILSSLKKIEGIELVLNRKNNAALIALGESNENLLRSFRNIPNIEIDEARNLNPVSVLNKKLLILVNPEASIRILQAKIKGQTTDNIQPTTVDSEPKAKKEVKKLSSKRRVVGGKL